MPKIKHTLSDVHGAQNKMGPWGTMAPQVLEFATQRRQGGCNNHEFVESAKEYLFSKRIINSYTTKTYGLNAPTTDKY